MIGTLSARAKSNISMVVTNVITGAKLQEITGLKLQTPA
jgi:hypothetical protein